MYDALYGRQSLDKKDSISVESQIEYCKYETHGEPYIEYIDKGYSGKNTNRPDFEKMMADIRDGKIKRVIVYKLDRISRSILDFANMMENFQTYNVEFVSSTEKFDTSTPIGRAMLNICIVFAQLERETIQKRVADAYYSRSKRGFYMGGRIPYGFKLKETIIDNVRTSMYEEVSEESEQLKLIYRLYANSDYSLGEIIRYLNEHGIENLRNGVWSTARISEMLRNPVYVQADIDVYNFFQSQGADIYNLAGDFTGENACYLYKGTASATRKQYDLTNKELVLAPHKGFVPSHEWIACRLRCLNNRQSTKTCKAKNSWLSGKVKCGNCGYALTIRKSKTKWGRYFICSAVGSTRKCKGTGGTIYADILEECLYDSIKIKLTEFRKLTSKEEKNVNPKINQNKIRISQINLEISDLLSKVGSANEILMQYINNKISELDEESKKLQAENITLTCGAKDKSIKQITNHIEKWDTIAFEDKQAVVDALIKVIHVANGNIEITWKI